jgi:site-specific DNA-methyltransferase (adenine-specific)
MPKENKHPPFARLLWERRDRSPPKAADLKLWSEFYPPGDSHPAEFQGRFILGDNHAVMLALLPDYEGKINLIYADPPFLTGKAYRARIGHGEDSRNPGGWETVTSYQDTWRDGGEYLDMLYPRLELMWRLLAPDGSLYLHLDWHISAYARVLLDNIFGPDRLLNEIVWVYHGPSPIRSAFNRKHDTILVYTKSKKYTFNVDAVRVPYNPSTVKTFASSDRAGFGKKPDLERGKVPEDWWYFPVVARMHTERTGYPTQKPEALMERIILASSNPGNLVADFFCGSGTTPSVASRLDRKWIACDPEPTALQTSYRRLMNTQGVKSFSVERTDSTEPSEILTPKITYTTAGPDVLIQLEHVTDRSEGTKLKLDHIVLWEVDTHFDGQIFRSRYQQARTWRKKTLEQKLRLNVAETGAAWMAVRVMDVKGNTGTIKFNVGLD